MSNPYTKFENTLEWLAVEEAIQNLVENQDLVEQNYKLEKLFSIRKVVSRFVKCYIARKGFLSGKEGLTISLLSAIYPFVSAMKARYDQD